MTRPELAELVEHWRAILLPEWRVVLHDKPWDDTDAEADDYWAISRSKDDYRQIDIFFTDELLALPANEVEVTVVHELLHALTRPWRAQINSLCGTLSREAYTTLADQRVHEEEQLVDRLSRVLVAQAHGAQPFGTFSHELAKVPSTIAEWQAGAPLMVDAPTG